MYCPKCGNEVNDDAEVCVHCGCSLTKTKPEYKESKTGLGVVMALFLGIIGLIIGIMLYPSGTIARKTFIKAWCITYAVVFVFAIILVIIIFATVASIPTYYY